MKSQIRVRISVLFLLVVLPAAFASPMAAADDEPTIAKDSVFVHSARGGSLGIYVKEGWRPAIEYRVNGPIASGSQLSVDFSIAGKPWVSFDCQTAETEKDHWWRVSCGGDSVSPSKAVTYAGPVEFAIHLRNELQGTNSTLFKGKAKVVRVPAYKGATKMDDMEWYVDDDWRIPIGYVFFAPDGGHGVTSLNVAFWYRGNPPDVEAHLFYKGKDIAKYTSAGNGAGDWDPSKHQWGAEECNFLGVYRTQQEADDGYDPKFGIDKNPGDYEVKVLVVNHLARSIKFSVGPDGKIVDNGIATANKLGTNRIIVPVQVIGNQGPWDKLAWKTGAFYGNPLSGFTPAE
jgi:hypothetical protein